MILRILGLIAICFLAAACGGDNGGPQETTEQSSADSERPGSVELPAHYPDLPEAVLDGTEISELAGLSLQTPGITMAGDYTVDQGGATLSVSLSVSDGIWKLRRLHAEPGWQPDVASYELRQDAGLLVSVDRQIFVLASAEGLLVNERGVEVVPGDLWILYQRAR